MKPPHRATEILLWPRSEGGAGQAHRRLRRTGHFQAWKSMGWPWGLEMGQGGKNRRLPLAQGQSAELGSARAGLKRCQREQERPAWSCPSPLDLVVLGSKGACLRQGASWSPPSMRATARSARSAARGRVMDPSLGASWSPPLRAKRVIEPPEARHGPLRCASWSPHLRVIEPSEARHGTPRRRRIYRFK